jgi:coatomer protein complex subunit epsilon
MGDELYDVRNSLILGNFHQTIAEGSSAKTVLKKPEDVAAFNVDRDALVARAQVELGQYDAVLSELRSASHPTLVAVRLWAELQRELASGLDGSAQVAKLVESARDVSAAKADAAVLAVAALIATQDVAGAVKLAHQWASGLEASATRGLIEMRALLADFYLRLNRADLAEKEVALMKTIDDEATLTILYQGIVALRVGAVKRDKFDEAAQSFQEINSRCGSSVLVLNLLALANLGRGKPADAERNLLDALAKKSGDADTIANLVVVASQLGKPTDRYVAQCRTMAKSLWTRQYSAMEDRFKEAALAFGA